MGASKSKVRKLNPKTLSELQRNLDVDFSREEIELWFREYQTSLGKGMNTLTMKEFKDVYSSVFDGDSSEFVSHLFRSFDADNDGFVDFKEFVVGLCVSGSEKVETKLKWAFKMYDVDGNGSITRDEMAGMLKAIYKMISKDVVNATSDIKQIEKLTSEFFESADRNHDNAISQDEFVDGVQAMPVILQLLQCDPDADRLEVPETNFDNLEEGGPSKDDQSEMFSQSSRASAYSVE